VTWFAGLFYMFRLFVYYAETSNLTATESSILRKQYLIMMKRLWYIITWPSLVLASVFGFGMIVLNPAWLQQGFMHVKLFFVLILYVYQVWGQVILNRITRGTVPYSSQQFRLLNELPTLILIAVVFIIVKKDSLNWIWGVIGIMGIAVALMIAIRLYKHYRQNK
jgi:putative membrane protein